MFVLANILQPLIDLTEATIDIKTFSSFSTAQDGEPYADANGNYSDFSPYPSSPQITPITNKQITYQSLPVPTEAKVVKKQVYRTLDGAPTVAYLDVETTNLALTTLTSNVTDAVLATRDAVAVVSSTGIATGFANAPPPSSVAFITTHLGRVFGAGEVSYSRGHVRLDNGSAIVTGYGVDWPTSFVGRYLYVPGAPKAYRITAITGPSTYSQEGSGASGMPAASMQASAPAPPVRARFCACT